LIEILKKIIRIIINSFGYDIHKTHFMQVLSPTTKAGIYRCKKRGIEISTVIDVGASDGRWTEVCMKYYPNAYYFLLEAQQPHEEKLIKLKNKCSNIDYVISAAGNKQGQIYFDTSALLFGVAQDEPFEKDCAIVPVTTIDYEVNARNLKPPFLIKLDVHGYEVPILEGAKETLSESNLLIIETYNFKLNKNCLRFYDICKYMENKGFYPIDIVEIIPRPYDYSFWQMDIFFIRSDRKEFTYNLFK